MERRIKQYLLSLGFLPNKCGYRFLYELIMQGVNGKTLLPLKFVAYKELADKYNKSVDSIEKDIQNAISSAWLCGDVDTLYSEFGETIDSLKGKPSNKHFILTAIESCKYEK